MTCHCGNCEDHRVDSWKMFDHGEAPVKEESTISLKKAAENAKDYLVQMEDARLEAAEREVFSFEEKRHINLIAKVHGHNTYFCISEGGESIAQLKTGIGANEMAFFFEEYMIPFRDIFEKLGFSVTEEVKSYEQSGANRSTT